MKDKKELQPYPAVFPVPALLLTVFDRQKNNSNIITIAWAGNVCSDPPMVSVSIRPARYSHRLLMETREFVLNIPTSEMIEKVDICGTKSGRDTDKFKETGFTPLPAKYVAGHHIAECPVNIEARVKHVINLGVHDLFIAQVVGVFVSEDYLAENGRRPKYDKIKAPAYCPEEYLTTEKIIGRYGFTLKR